MRERPKLRRVTEEMREWSVHLDSELTSWPDVRRKPMFGMIAFYRRDVIFAAVPRTKSFEPDNSVAFKLYEIPEKLQAKIAKDKRIALGAEKSAGWILFQVNDARDLAGALSWFETAYERAAQQASPKR